MSPLQPRVLGARSLFPTPRKEERATEGASARLQAASRAGGDLTDVIIRIAAEG